MVRLSVGLFEFSFVVFTNFVHSSSYLSLPWIALLVDVLAHVQSDEDLLDISSHGGIVQVDGHLDGLTYSRLTHSATICGECDTHQEVVALPSRCFVL